MIKNKNIREFCQLKNNANGKKELAAIKRLFKGTEFRVIVRGRNSDRRGTVEKAGKVYCKDYRYDIPLEYAERFAVYIKQKATGRHMKGLTPVDKFEYNTLQYSNQRLTNEIEAVLDENRRLKEIIEKAKIVLVN